MKTFWEFFFIGMLAGFVGTLSVLIPAAMPYLFLGGLIGVAIVWLCALLRFCWKHRHDERKGDI